jgi:CrcB protein
MVVYFWIAVGGALGSVARYGFSSLIARQFGETFPWGTLIVNLSGSFAIGLLASLSESGGRRFFTANQRQFLMTGICGGYTTFSAFSLQTLEQLRNREWFYAGSYVLLSFTLCLVAVWLGYLAGASINSVKGH